jgi:hypothetical protein
MDAETILLNPRALEASLKQVQGVYACRVVLDSPNEISEIHVVGSASRKPKQIVRDIESLLFARFGLRVNYRKISLAQIQEEKAFSLLGSRPRLLLADWQSSDNADAVLVRLADNGNVFEGTAQAAKSTKEKGWLACTATLDALNKLLGAAGEFHLEALQLMPIAAREVLVVLVTFGFAAGEEHLIGTSFYRGDIMESAVRATLDSVNRRLALIRSL